MATSTDLRAAIQEVHRKLPGKKKDPDYEFDFETDWATRVEERMGRAPWWVISCVIHAVLFLLATLLTVALPPSQRDEVVITSDVAKEKEPEYDPKKKRDIFKNPQEIKHETEVEKPVLIHEEAEISDHFETDNDMETSTARGSEDAISDIPLGGTGVAASIGVGGGGMGGCFGYRDGGGRKRATKRFGGSPATESAVEAALQWLKRHQESSGYWDAHKWKDMPSHGFIFNRGQKVARPEMDRVNVSMTGMALLAFLGAGYTAKAGKHKETVDRAQNWLMSVLADRVKSGMKYGTFDQCNYTQGMATLAIAEAYGMTKTEELKKAAQAAIDVIIANQGPYEAWDYRAKTAAGRNDTSVSGWNLMALKSAKIAGLKVDNNAFQGCMRWLDAATDPANGKCSYSGYTVKKGRFRGARRGSGSNAMWAAGMLMRQFMGAAHDDPILRKAAVTIGQEPPKWEVQMTPARTYPARVIPARVIPARTIPARTIGGKHFPAQKIPERRIPEQRIPARTIPARNISRTVNFYYWYYATLCMFQMGGDHWKTWNVQMKKALLENQCKGGPLDGTKKDKDGSWDPTGGGHVSYGGRVFSTALGALTLEVYYRYLPLYTQD
ncbi:MAG: prenyltransferase/squalene oxidase repeat-containing protein [Planctomycetota bacterium]|jgi:hypothetical protein